MIDKDFLDFIQKVKNVTGIDLSLYKEAQMKRRLTALRQKRGHNTFISFFDEMVKSREVMDEFLDRMTINVSEFFRNESRWSVLEKQILPRLLKEKGRVKTWSAACSTGEEPYTLAMIYKHYLKLNDFNILATDLDEGVIKKAKEGWYNERALTSCPKELISKYFSQNIQNFKISEDIKKHITFKKHNLLADNFESDFDLIVCRNVMIYFTEEAKEQLYHKFSKALRPGGILFVGSTEQIFQPQKFNFEVEDTFFYRKV